MLVEAELRIQITLLKLMCIVHSVICRHALPCAMNTLLHSIVLETKLSLFPLFKKMHVKSLKNVSLGKSSHAKVIKYKI